MKKLAQKKRTDRTSSVIVCFYEHLCDLGEKKIWILREPELVLLQ